jgi:NAD dependent epimerase/dehydratase family
VSHLAARSVARGAAVRVSADRSTGTAANLEAIGGAAEVVRSALRQRRRPTVYGDGGQTRDFVYVDDVVQANLLAAESPAAPVASSTSPPGARSRSAACWPCSPRSPAPAPPRSAAPAAVVHQAG